MYSKNQIVKNHSLSSLSKFFYIRICLSWKMLSGFCPTVEDCSAVFCSTDDTHLQLLDRVFSGASFLTCGVFESDIAHRRSVAVLSMLFKIRCNPMHPLSGALPEPYVPVCITRGAMITHWYTYAPTRCRTSQ